MRADQSRIQQLLMLLTAFLALHQQASAVPLFQLLKSTAEVSNFVSLLNQTGLGLQMNNPGGCNSLLCFLVFAPSNTAIDNAYSADPSGFSSIDKSELVNQHFIASFNGGTKGLLSAWNSIGTPIGQDIGFGQVKILQTAKNTIYWLAKQTGSTWSYRINNAAIMVASSDKEADNGVFHVLDQVILPIGDQQSFNNLQPSSTIANQLSIKKSLTIFNDWAARDTSHQYVYNAVKASSPYKVRTVFLPSDAAWDRIPSAALQSLNNSADSYRNVFLAHFAPDICLFTSWMSLGSEIQFSTGLKDFFQYNDTKMYMNSAGQGFVAAGGVVAQFVNKAVNYATADTVIHVVDRVLAFAYDDLASLAQANTPDFYRVCSGVPSCMSLLTNNSTKLTLFAPADVTRLSSSLIDATQREQLLLLHFLPGVIGKPSMKYSDLLASSSLNGQIRFRTAMNGTKFYVEGRLNNRGFVRAELTMYDQPAKNGIFHKVSGTLGLPVQTIQEFINWHEDLRSVSSYMGLNSFDPNLGDAARNFTVFAPNNTAITAFASYTSSGRAVGDTIMKSASLRDRVFRRGVLPNVRLIADVAPAGTTEYPTANTIENEKISVNLQGSAGLNSRTVALSGSFSQASVGISLAEGEYECTNGMVYPSGQVLFNDNDVQGYTRAGSAVLASWVSLATALAALMAARRAAATVG